VTVNPTALSLQTNKSVQFTDLVSTTSSVPIHTTVTWSVEQIGVTSGADYGSITQTGLYTAPANVPLGGLNPIPVYVVSTEDPTKQAIAYATITTAPVPLGISTTLLPNGNANSSTAYSTTISAYGGVQPYTWSITSGSLPTGLSLNSSSGVISGTPTVAGAYSFTATVTDSTTPTPKTASVNLNITINPQLIITTTALPNGVVGGPYSSSLAATGGVTSYTWSVSPSLPSGLSLNASTGAITGTPASTSAGMYNLTFKATDSGTPQQTATFSTTITIYTGLTITSLPLTNGVAGAAYSQTVSVGGGTAPYTWSLTGTPPASTCLALASATTTTGTNSITGTPAAGCVGTYTFNLQVTDSSTLQQTKTQAESVIIYSALTFPAVTLPGAAVGTPYSSALSVSGGTAPYLWSISSGILPSCLALASLSTATGANSITGNPVAGCVGGPFSFTVQVTDSSVPPQTKSQPLGITIYPGLTITSAALPNGVAGTAYSQPVSLAGGLAPYTWSLTGTSPPPSSCLALTTMSATSATTNTITGTPGAGCAGTYNFTLQVSDNSSPQQVKTQAETVIIYTALSLTPPTLPTAVVNTTYTTTTLTATNGTSPYTYSIVSGSGSLPPGLTLTPATPTTSASIGGTPTTAGTYTFKVQVQDSSVPPQQFQTQSLSITIYTALSITSLALPNDVVGTPYNQTVSVMGGTPPYTYSFTGATPPSPSCLALTTMSATSATTNTITGTPAAGCAGQYSFNLQVTDSSAPAQVKTQAEAVNIYTLLVFPGTPPLPSGVVGTGYSGGMSVSGGTAPYNWSVGSGLPSCLALTSTQTSNGSNSISGSNVTAACAGTWNFTVTVTDTSVPPQSRNQSLSIAIYTGLTITSGLLPNGVAGTPYNQTVSVGGGTPPYTWNLLGNPPSCLQLATASPNSTSATTNTVMGNVSGCVGGPYSFQLWVKDSTPTPQIQTQSESIYIYSALTLPSATLAAGAVGTAYTASIPTPTTGTSPYTYALATGSGPLPTSLGLNANTGAITGTPSTPGSFSFNVTVTDTSVPAQTATTGFTIPVLGVTTTGLSSGVVGTGYNQTLTAVGNVGTLTWSITNGSLPTCLSLTASSGLISGTPTSVGTCLGTYNFTAVVTDGTSGLSASKALSITINLAYNITTTTVPNGGMGTPYTSTQLTVTGGTGTLSWTVNSGVLPPGLNLSTGGVISGTPTAGGQFNFTVQVTDQSTPNKTATQGYTITILSFAPTTIPTGTTNSVYPTVTFTASNGTTPYMWQKTGSLPTGISFTPSSTTATLSGTPTASGTFPITVTVTDSAGTPLVATQNFNLTVNSPQPLGFNTTGIYDGTVGQPYSATLNASGGTPTYQWNILPNLPPCLTLSNGVGAQVTITGTPAATCEGSYTFTVQLMDSANPAPGIVTQQFSININAAGNAVCETGNEQNMIGQYAFELRGFNASGFQAVVGSVTLNGTSNNGQILGGEVDVNTPGGTHTVTTSVSGTYTLGGDGRGCMSITAGATTYTTRIAMGSPQPAGTVLQQGSIIEFDAPTSSAFIASGPVFQQTFATTSTSASNFTALSGNYSRLFTGWDSTAGTRIACASTQTESGGIISNSQKDCDDGGVLSSNTGAGLSTGISTGNQGTYTAPDANGRVTEATGSGATANARVLYMNSAGTAGLVLTTENGGANTVVMAGQLAQQSGTLAASNGSFVYYMSGVSGTSGDKVEFGVSTTTAAGAVTVQDYENNAGAYENNGTLNCTYSVATNGRETVSGCGTDSPITYLVSPTQGFMVGTDSSVEAGQTLAQTVPSGGFSATTVNGQTYFGGTTEVLNQNGEVETDIITFSGGTEDTLAGTGTSDTTSTNYQEAGQVGPIAEGGNGPTIAAATGFISQTKNNQTQVQGVAIDATHFLITNNHGSSWPSISLLGPASTSTVSVVIETPTTAQNVTVNGSVAIVAGVGGTTAEIAAGVTWSVNGITNGNSTWGTITGSGTSVTYNAPSTVPSPASFTVTATSNADASKSASLTVEIYGVGQTPVAITTTTLPPGTVGVSYSQGLATNGGGQPPYTWTIISGALPPGLMLNLDTGQITGTPIAFGGSGLPVAASSFTVEATDASASQHTATQALSISVAKSTTVPNGITVSNGNVTGVNLSLSTMTTTLALADVGTCIVGISCNASVTGIQVSKSGAQTSSCASTTTPATCTVWLLGQGLTNGTGSALASGLAVRVTGPSSPDVTVSNISPNSLNGSLTNITFLITVSPSAATGNRDIVVTLGDGETQVYIGAIQIVP
jgi:hypothetical protein